MLLALFAAVPGVGAGEHVVVAGDTLSGIARRYHTSVDALAKANNLRKPYPIRVGDKLKLPPTFSIYTVKKNDALGRIAARHKVTVGDILAVNELADADRLDIGQRLIIPLPGNRPTRRVRPALPASVNMQLARVRPRRAAWHNIVIHHTATPSATFKGLDNYHRNERRMQNGLAYHFVIGNGRGQGDGEIHITRRWKEQLSGGHMKTEALNYRCIGVCLVGNFEETRPTARQMDSLKRLVLYLMEKQRLGSDKVAAHGALNPSPTSCPGRNFPLQDLRRQLRVYE